MTKNEVIELVKSGRLRGFLPPEMAQYEVNVEQMDSYRLHHRAILILKD